MNKDIALTNISQVTAGQDFTINCPVGPTYRKIRILLTNITLAQLTNIRISINSKVVQTFDSGTDLNMINKYYSRYDGSANGFLEIPFERSEYLQLMHQRMFAFGTADVDTFQVTAHVDPACVNPAVSAQALVNTIAQKLGVITKIKNFPVTFATSGEQLIDNIPRGPRIQAIHFVKSDITKLRCVVDSVEIRNVTAGVVASENEQEQFSAKRTPQTGVSEVLDFHLEGDVDRWLVTGGVQSLQFFPTITTSGALKAIVEYADVFAGI